VIKTRDKLIKNLQLLDFEVLPSGANFILTKHKTYDGAKLTEKLREQNIIVRHFKNPTRISPYIRITIGTDQQTERLIASLQTILN